MNILFLGDSLIEYFHWQGWFSDHRVYNLGLAGESVGGMLSRLADVKEACPEADRIFIMSGINNLAMGDLEFIESYKETLEKLSSYYPGAVIYINSLLPAAVDFIPAGSIGMVNEALKVLAKDKGANYIDLYSKFINTAGRPIREYLQDDGVHLSMTGYEVWAHVVGEILNIA